MEIPKMPTMQIQEYLPPQDLKGALKIFMQLAARALGPGKVVYEDGEERTFQWRKVEK